MKVLKRFAIPILCIALVGGCLMNVLDVFAANKEINISMKYLGYSSTKTISQMKYLKKKIGGMSQKKNKSYPDYYVSGKKIVIGVNENACVEHKTNYLYISNSGNKKVKLLGVRIGMTAAQAKKKLIKEGLTSKNKKIYYWGDAGMVKLTIKKNKVTGYKFFCAPTG